MTSLSGIVEIPLLKKSRFTGSDNYMCLMPERRSGEEVTRLMAVIRPGSYCYGATPEKEKIMELSELPEGGLEQAVVWTNEQSKLEANQKIC